MLLVDLESSLEFVCFAMIHLVLFIYCGVWWFVFPPGIDILLSKPNFSLLLISVS